MLVISRGCLPVMATSCRKVAASYLPATLTWSERKKVDSFLKGEAVFPLTVCSGMDKQGRVEPDWVITEVIYVEAAKVEGSEAIYSGAA